MKNMREALGRVSKVKATMLKAHLDWAEKQFGDLSRLSPHVDAECADLLRGTLSTARSGRTAPLLLSN